MKKFDIAYYVHGSGWIGIDAETREEAIAKFNAMTAEEVAKEWLEAGKSIVTIEEDWLG